MLKHLVLTMAVVGSLSSDVLAMKLFHEMVPENLGTGFKLEKSESADDTWLFTFTRKTPPALSRHASLTIVDESGTEVAHMELAPKEANNGDLKYRFSISRSLAKNSRLELSETPKQTEAIQEVGGGNIFSFTLIDFIENTSGIERFLRRHKIDIESLKAPNENTADDEPSVERKSPSQ